jgi:tRNA(Arg) A34 adenosine deaminase TadA
MNSQDHEFMQAAIDLAQQNVQNHTGGPFGSVVVKDGEIIGKGVNTVTTTNDPTAHAEVVAIREACRHVGTFQLDGCTLYTSCEPCPMCLSAMYWARIDRLVYACSREDAACAGFDDAWFYAQVSLPLHEQEIKSNLVGREEGLKVFKAWEEDDEKTPY